MHRTVIARYGFLCLLCLSVALAAVAETASPDTEERASGGASHPWNHGELKRLNAFLQFQSEALSGEGTTFQDVRVSPMIREEFGYEIPIEISFTGSEDALAPFLKKAETFKADHAVATHRALTVAHTPETLSNRKQLLTVSVNQSFIVGNDSARVQSRDRVYLLSEAVSDILKRTSFEPRIRRGGGEVAKEAPHWLTNLRIDRDLRVQLTGYGLSFPAVTALAESLYQDDRFAEVFLTNAHRSVFEKQTVWRFDIVGRLR